MKQKLIVFDKDHTLVKPKSGEVFVRSPWDQEPLNNDIVLGLQRLKAAGWMIAVASNQGGVPEYKSLEEAFLEMKYLLEMFPEISEVLFAPGMVGSRCWRCWGECGSAERIEYNFSSKQPLIPEGIASFRKPDAGMLQLLIDSYSPDEIIFVGDRPEDQGAAQNCDSPVTFVWTANFAKEIALRIEL